MKTALLKGLYNIFPFPLQGDVECFREEVLSISCIIPTFQRDKDLAVILGCLSAQNMQTQEYEVIVVEDGADEDTGLLIGPFKENLNIIHLTNPVPKRNVASLRNQGLRHARGSYVLFLDDDTILPQEDFLTRLTAHFASNPQAGVIQIPGEASYGLRALKYDYLDKYSFATRCVAYRRQALESVCGFLEELTSYEDIELSIRFVISGGQSVFASDLGYRHPPLFFDGWRKPICNGESFLRLFNRYSKPLWCLCYLNAMRFLPFLLVPNVKCRQWGKISAGFLIAPIRLMIKIMTSSNVRSIYR